MGHTVKRCPQASTEAGDSNGFQAAGDSGWGTDAPAPQNGGLYGNDNAAPAAAAAAAGGGGGSGWSAGGGGEW